MERIYCELLNREIEASKCDYNPSSSHRICKKCPYGQNRPRTLKKVPPKKSPTRKKKGYEILEEWGTNGFSHSKEGIYIKYISRLLELLERQVSVYKEVVKPLAKTYRAYMETIEKDIEIIKKRTAEDYPLPPGTLEIWQDLLKKYQKFKKFCERETEKVTRKYPDSREYRIVFLHDIPRGGKETWPISDDTAAMTHPFIVPTLIYNYLVRVVGRPDQKGKKQLPEGYLEEIKILCQERDPDNYLKTLNLNTFRKRIAKMNEYPHRLKEWKRRNLHR